MASNNDAPAPHWLVVILNWCMLLVLFRVVWWAIQQPATWKAIALSVQGFVKAMALSGLIIGSLMVITTPVIGVAFGIPMIITCSMILCCCCAVA